MGDTDIGDLKMEADDVIDSYEALPPNYGLTHNMLAGAFAGIAVSTAAH